MTISARRYVLTFLWSPFWPVNLSLSLSICAASHCFPTFLFVSFRLPALAVFSAVLYSSCANFLLAARFASSVSSPSFARLLFRSCSTPAARLSLPISSCTFLSRSLFLVLITGRKKQGGTYGVSLMPVGFPEWRSVLIPYQPVL